MSSTFEQLGTEALGFNSEVVAEVKEFTLLPPGKYPFTITNVEKGYTDVATAKIPAKTPKAVITLEADGGDLGKNKVTSVEHTKVTSFNSYVKVKCNLNK